jgi:ssDNA-binding Zn-finger/Zn-ribbon topoisomerase 1
MEKEYQDKTIKCVQCKEDFVLEAGEQKFFESKEFPEPKRCAECRRQRKETRRRLGM